MTPTEAAHEIETALRAANAWPAMKVEQDILSAQIIDTQRRLLKSHTEKYRRERARLEGHLDRMCRELKALQVELEATRAPQRESQA